MTRPRTNQVIAFPLKEVLEKDANGQLYLDVWTHMEAISALLNDDAWKQRCENLVLREKLAASRAGQILTTRMMSAASLMILARNWLAERVADDDAITQLGRLGVGIGDEERWWDDESTPEELQQLCLIAEGLLARVRSAAGLLRKAVEAEQTRGAA